MAWNRPIQKDERSLRLHHANRKIGKGPIVFSLLILVITIGTMVWLFDSNSAENIKLAGKTVAKPSIIPDTSSNVVRRSAVQQSCTTNRISSSTSSEGDGFITYTNKLGQVRRSKAKPVVIKTNPDKQLFSCPGDRLISSLVNVIPGEMIVDPDLPSDFREILTEALVTKIEILEDDTPFERLKKQRVIEAKEQIQAMLKNGEDIEQAFRETKKKLIKQNQVFREMQTGYEELKVSGATPAEIIDYVYAAEKVMKDKGIETDIHVPLKLRKQIKDLKQQAQSMSKEVNNEVR